MLSVSVAEKKIEVKKYRKVVLSEKVNLILRQATKIAAYEAKVVIVNSNHERKIIFY